MAEQTAQDVVTETQLAGDASSADALGPIQTPLVTHAGEEVAAEKEAGPTENITESVTSRQGTAEIAPLNEHGISEDTTQATEHQQADATREDLLESAEARSSEESIESPSIIKDTPSVGDALSVQGSGDASHAGPDTATNSDTEAAGKTEEVEAKTVSTIRKPAAFKSVSVTKNFLAKSGTPAPVTAKTLGDKLTAGAPKLSLTPTLRPRLVAKAGRDVRPIGSTGTAGPDASSVWNRNKPVVPPPPKHYTDEELKQQYGIQLATRLGADLPGKDSKWADIDDEDEGDWVPESVQWVDGTKSTPQQEDQIPIAADEIVILQAAQIAEERPAEPIQPESKPASTSGKTILRPGARLVPITKPGLVLKSLPEKPTQEERPTSTSTSKSPWAKLPAVEKASPISFEPPPPEPRQTYVSGDARESYRPDRFSSSSPAREIEPDTFSRTWRESERGGNRELFNSQSGRYEPVKASRRLSRPESSLRPSSLLQRPSQGGAEQRDSVSDDRAWTRKSVSSSRADGEAADVESDLKHHSGATPPQLHFSDENPDSVNLSSNKDHPSNNTVSSVGQSIDKDTAHSTSQLESKLDPAPPTEDVRAVQQRLMQERIAAARKRKQEEEAEEEAAKQKRIAARLAALEAQTPSVAQKSEVTKEKPTSTDPDSKVEAKPLLAATQELSSAKLPSSEPFASERHDQAVPHQTSSRTGPSGLQTNTAQTSPPKPESHVLQSPARTTLRSDTTAPLGFASPSRRRFNAPSLSKSLSDPAGLEITEEVQDLPGLGQLPEDRVSSTTNTWQNVSLPQVPESSLGWAANMARNKMHGGSVWGVPSSDRSLGNGAFDRGMPHIQLPPQVNQAPAYLTEAAERVPSLSPGLSFDTSSHTAVSPQPIGQRTPEYQQHAFQQQHHAMQQHNHVVPYTQTQHQMPGYRVNRPSPPVVHDQHRQNASRAWRDFGAAAEVADAEAREAARLEYLARMNEGPPRSLANDYQPTYHETFKKTTPGEVLGQRRVVSVVKTVHEGGQPANTEVTPVQAPIGTPYAREPQHHIPVNLPMSSTRASSRFFGYGLERPNLTYTAMPSESSLMTLGSAWSPPPPDSADHPVYGGSRHPFVHLPPPAPVVKLPPQPMRMVPTEDTPVVMPPRSFRPGIQPIVANADWQQRFNGLFGRPDPSQAMSPPSDPIPAFPPAAVTSPALAVDTSSKAALEVSARSTPAIIALPTAQGAVSAVKITLSPGFTEVESKSIEAEEELWQDREFGSLPIIQLPMANMWFYSDAATPFTRDGYPNGKAVKLQQLEMSKDFTSTVPLGSPHDLSADMTLGSIQIIIRLLNGEAKTVMMYAKPDTSGPPRRSKKPKNKSFRDNRASSQDLSSSAPSGVENERRPYKKSKRGSRGVGPTSPSSAGPNENVHGSHEGGLHGHGRPPRASRGGFKRAHNELSTV